MTAKKVFIISLPRHGTTSTEAFLEAHGLPLAHNGKLPTDDIMDHWHPDRMMTMHRQISQGNFQLPLFDNGSCAGISGYPASSHYRELARQYPDALFIHITRNKEEWLDSAEPFLAATARSREGNIPLQQAFHFFRTKMFGVIPQSRGDYADAYDRHYADVAQFGEEIGSDRFISLDLKELTHGNTAIDRLCNFIGIQRNPEIPFPNKNGHTAHYLTSITKSDAHRSGQTL